jgi:Trk-type K+ transport system membrane component
MDTKQEIKNIFSRHERICLYGTFICVSVWVVVAIILNATNATQQIIDMWVTPGVIAVALSACMLNNVFLYNKIMSKLEVKEGV